MSFKKNRKSIAQISREKRQNERREKLAFQRQQSRVVSTALRIPELGFFPPILSEEAIPTHDIGLFRFSMLNPLESLRGIRNKFSEETDFGLIAPYRDEIYYELFTNVDWWSETTFDDKPFLSWEFEEQLKIIQGFNDVILFLFRVRGFTFFSAPFDIIGSNLRFLREAKNSSVTLRTRMKESLLDAIHLPNYRPKVLDKNDVEWISERLVPVYTENKNGGFNFLFEIYESLHYPNPAVQLTQIWAGIEFIVKSSYSRVRRSIKARCAMILGKTAEQQRKIFSDVGKLYNQRSAVIHGVEPFTMQTVLSNLVRENGETKVSGTARSLWDSFKLLNDLVVKAIGQESKLFSMEDLDFLEKEFAENHPDLFNA